LVKLDIQFTKRCQILELKFAKNYWEKIIMEKDFFIKKGYQPNRINLTLDSPGGETYWDEQRLKTAEVFQHAVYSEALNWAKKNKVNRILDVGSGPPVKLEELKTQFGSGELEIWLMDQPSLSELIRKRWQHYKFIPADLETVSVDLPIKFDLIICADVIEHLVDPLNLLKFLYANLSTEGRIFLSTPERDLLRGEKCLNSPHPMHIREWNSQELRCLLNAAGFAVTAQKLLPPKRLFLGDIWASKLLDFLRVRHAMLHSCQMAILAK
jgi:SAM-dependent methyltransferase